MRFTNELVKAEIKILTILILKDHSQAEIKSKTLSVKKFIRCYFFNFNKSSKTSIRLFRRISKN